MVRSGRQGLRPDTKSVEKRSSKHPVCRPTQLRRSKIVSPNQTSGGSGWNPSAFAREAPDRGARACSPWGSWAAATMGRGESWMPLRCSLPPTPRTRRASRHDLDLGAEGLRREAAVPPDAERALPAVKGHDPAQDLDAVLSGPHHPGSQELPRMVRFGEVHDRLVAVLLELALAERSHNSRHLALFHTRRHRPMGYKASGCAPTAARRSVQEPVRLELGRDLLDGLLDVRGLAGPRADDLAAAEHQEDDLRLVDAIDEARELLRLVFDRTGPEGDRDRVEVERGAEGRGRDDVLDLDLRVLLNRDAGRLDLLRDEVDRGLDVLEALPAGADDFTAAGQEDPGLRLLDAIDEAGELLRLVLGATEGEGDRLEVELAPEGGRRNHVLDPEVGHGEPPRRALQAVAV